MSHEIHAKALLMAISQIDECIAEAVDTGAVPVLDAVEMARLLRALVAGAPSHKVNRESLRRRLDRMQASAENPVARTTVTAVGVEWERRPAGEGGAS